MWSVLWTVVAAGLVVDVVMVLWFRHRLRAEQSRRRLAERRLATAKAQTRRAGADDLTALMVAVEDAEDVHDARAVLAEEGESVRAERAWAAVEEMQPQLNLLAAGAQPHAEVQAEALESSPLYEETLAAVPVTQPDADLLTAQVWQEEPAQPEVPDTQEGGGHEDDDQDEDPPPPADPPAGGPADDNSASRPSGEVLASTMVLAPEPRYGWPERLVSRPVWGVLPSDKLRTWRHRARRVVARLTHPPRVRVRRLHPVWAAGQLTLLMTGEMPVVRVIVRHRRGGGTWAVAG